MQIFYERFDVPYCCFKFLRLHHFRMGGQLHFVDARFSTDTTAKSVCYQADL